MKTVLRQAFLVGLCVTALFLAFLALRAKNARPPDEKIVLTSATNIPGQVPQMTTRAFEYSAKDRADLEKRFNEKFKPVINKWCQAYAGRIPFSAEEVTFETFHSRLAGGIYTFMIRDITFSIRERTNIPAKVVYMTHGKTLLTLNDVSPTGKPRDLSLPISREEVIQMVKVDCGVTFKPNECLIRPTGAYGNLNGGADVSMLPTGADPNNGLASKIDLVFDADGKLVYYDRDPLF
ncbi:MAG: hypothetical protein M9920_05605 [Verrucomicrobiae bacterium]|nr:hypothetical protein [Verrucomicrobiae bacterium]